MSKMITERDLRTFESMEQDWLEDQGDYEDFWEKKIDDENEFFEWLRVRFERTTNIFSDLSGLKPAFYGKVIDMLTEAAMVGFFFGELRWQGDIDSMIKGATEGMQFSFMESKTGDFTTAGEE